MCMFLLSDLYQTGGTSALCVRVSVCCGIRVSLDLLSLFPLYMFRGKAVYMREKWRKPSVSSPYSLEVGGPPVVALAMVIVLSGPRWPCRHHHLLSRPVHLHRVVCGPGDPATSRTAGARPSYISCLFRPYRTCAPLCMVLADTRFLVIRPAG